MSTAHASSVWFMGTSDHDAAALVFFFKMMQAQGRDVHFIRAFGAHGFWRKITRFGSFEVVLLT